MVYLTFYETCVSVILKRFNINYLSIYIFFLKVKALDCKEQKKKIKKTKTSHKKNLCQSYKKGIKKIMVCFSKNIQPN